MSEEDFSTLSLEEGEIRPTTSLKHDVHRLAQEANEIEASIERFLDEALITEMREAPLTTMEDVMEERRSRELSTARVHDRAKELLKEELSKAEHERDVEELERAVAASKQPASDASKAGAASEESETSRLHAEAPVKLNGAGCSKGLKPCVRPCPLPLASATPRVPVRARTARRYLADLTEFVPEGEASRKARTLREENDLLRKCLADAGNPRAFEGCALPREPTTRACGA